MLQSESFSAESLLEQSSNLLRRYIENKIVIRKTLFFVIYRYPLSNTILLEAQSDTKC